MMLAYITPVLMTSQIATRFLHLLFLAIPGINKNFLEDTSAKS